MDNTVHDSQRLKELQALPLERKIQITQNRIQEWYMHYDGGVYVSFSGGKDSTVLAYLTRQLFPDVPLVFSNTGLEYSSIQKFARDAGAVFVYPKMGFSDVVSTYGYPLISKEVAEAIYYARRIKNSGVATMRERVRTILRKRPELLGMRTVSSGGAFSNPWLYDETGVFQGNRRTILLGNEPDITDGSSVSSGKSMFNKEKWLPAAQELPIFISHYCCNVMKKLPMKKYSRVSKRKPIIGTLTDESRIRKQAWIRHGCNSFDSKSPTSQPMSFWTEQDVLTFIKQSGIQIADVYGDIVPMSDKPEAPLCCTGCDRTGCTFCGFGAHNKNDNRFLTLAELDLKKYEYSMNGGQWVDNPRYDATAPEYDGVWKNWNPKKIWVPSKEGLGLRKVFDMFNELYPNNKIQY